MKILAVDDERPMLRLLEEAISTAAPDAQVYAFQSSLEAAEYAKNMPIDVAFLDVKMPALDGFSLAKRLKELNNNVNIIFVTGYSDYTQEAFDIYASGYVMKPVDSKIISEQLNNLRYSTAPSVQPNVHIRCFDGFGVFVDGRPILMTQAKAKELLAYLVHRQGAPVTNGEIAGILWEGREYDVSLKSHTRVIISQLSRQLENEGIRDIMLRAWNNTAIDVSKISCDYYDYLAGDHETPQGKYLYEYKWASPAQ